MRQVLKMKVKASGGIRPWCAEHGIASHSSVSQMLSGKRDVSGDVALCCGFVAEMHFRKVDDV